MNSLLYGGNKQSIRLGLVRKMYIEQWPFFFIEKQIILLSFCFLLTLIVHIVHIIQKKIGNNKVQTYCKYSRKQIILIVSSYLLKIIPFQ